MRAITDTTIREYSERRDDGGLEVVVKGEITFDGEQDAAEDEGSTGHVFRLVADGDGDEDAPLEMRSFGELGDTTMRGYGFVALAELAGELGERGISLNYGPFTLARGQDRGQSQTTTEAVGLNLGEALEEADDTDIGEADHSHSAESESDDVREEEESAEDGDEWLDHTSTADLQQAYDDANGNIKKAAERFDVGYSAVFKRMKDAGVHTPARAVNVAADGSEADHEDQAVVEDGGAVAFSDFKSEPGNGRQCRNCGAHVTRDFTRVMEGADEGAPRCCPKCTDLVRKNDGSIREARSGTRGRRGGGAS